MATKTCQICGAKFTPKPRNPNQKYRSKQCSQKARYIKSPSSTLTHAHECGHLIPNSAIMCARRKPQGTSAVRWRMELRRRANPERYEMLGRSKP